MNRTAKPERRAARAAIDGSLRAAFPLRGKRVSMELNKAVRTGRAIVVGAVS